MPLSKKSFLYPLGLFGISLVPAALLLTLDGFMAPVAIPFGITSEEALHQPSPIVWIDARPDDSYKSDHVPGAINLNRNNWNYALADLFKTYAPGKEIIVYCSSGCTESQKIADRIRNLGLDRVLVLEGGFDAWRSVNLKP